MRHIKKAQKTGFLKKILIKFCRYLGFELIDQTDMSFVTSIDQKNASIIGKKSITLPLGELKIKRKIQNLHIILKTCTSVNLVTQNKKRIFEEKKSEYTFRTIYSIIKSLNKAKEKTKNIQFQITIIDAGSNEVDTLKMQEILNKSKFEFNFINLKISDYISRIKILKKK